MLSEEDKRFFALFLKQRKHEAKFGKKVTTDVEAKYERQLEVREEARKLVEKWEKTGLLDYPTVTPEENGEEIVTNR